MPPSRATTRGHIIQGSNGPTRWRRCASATSSPPASTARAGARGHRTGTSSGPARGGPVARGANGANSLDDGRIEGDDPLAPFSPTAPRHLLRTDGFAHVADIMVGSFYEPDLEEGCAFEELISFHGGLGGPQTRPFVLSPAELPVPGEPIVGAAALHDVLAGWRRLLQEDHEPRPAGGAARRARDGRPRRPGPPT